MIIGREGRLEKITQSTGGQIHKLKFLYSSEGRRIMKIDSSALAVDTTYYIYDGMFAVAELNGHLDLKSKYVYTNGMLVGRIDSDGKLYQYFHDGLGSITMITDSTGEYQNLYLYDDFGNFRKKVENTTNSYYYTGQERDESPSGLYNLRARYYAPALGRFTQEDPLLRMGNSIDISTNRVSSCLSDNCTEFKDTPNLLSNPTFLNKLSKIYMSNPQNLNQYLYVSNNPLNRIDIDGLFWREMIECTKWSVLCAKRGLECKKKLREKLECMSLEEQIEWLQAHGYAGLSEAYKDVCFDQIPACQKMLYWCAKAGSEPQ